MNEDIDDPESRVIPHGLVLVFAAYGAWVIMFNIVTLIVFVWRHT